MTSNHTNRLYDFLTAIHGTKTASDAWNVSVDFFRDHGVSHIAMGNYTDNALTFVKDTAPDWACESWQENVGIDIDPCAQHSRRHHDPYFGGIEFEPQAPAPYTEWLNDVSGLDIRSYVCFPCHLSSYQTYGDVLLYTNQNAREFTHFYSDHGGMFHLAAITAYDKYMSLVSKDDIPVFKLTQRERECLLWLSRGYRNDQIASRLSLKPVTIDFHFTNARKKLGAKTREQAIAIAIRAGLIEP